MKPGVMAAIVVAVLVAIGAFVFISSDDSTETADTNSSQTTQATNEEAQEATEQAEGAEAAEQAEDESIITAETVATHGSEDDCWTIVSGSVYDITSYVPRHPGGEEILRACGADGTSLFTQRTTEDGEEVGTGNPHSSKAAGLLADFKVGELAR